MHVRNVNQQHIHLIISGPKDKVDIKVFFDRASCAVGDSKFRTIVSVFFHLVSEGVM